MNATIKTGPDNPDFWSVPVQDLLGLLRSTPQGMSDTEAPRILAGRAPHLIKAGRWRRAVALLLAQFTSPIILILLAAAVLSLFLGEITDATIVLVIVLASGLLGFWQEWRAEDALRKLLGLVETRTSVLRDGVAVEIPIDRVVPGDVALLRAGDVIPGDGRLLDENDLYVSEATLTGERTGIDRRLNKRWERSGRHRCEDRACQPKSPRI